VVIDFGRGGVDGAGQLSWRRVLRGRGDCLFVVRVLAQRAKVIGVFGSQKLVGM
jgi:hypothetical protein